MLNIPLPSVVLLSIIIAGAGFGAGYLVAIHSSGDANSNPFRYCYLVNTNDSYVRQFAPWVSPGEYAICKVG